MRVVHYKIKQEVFTKIDREDWSEISKSIVAEDHTMTVSGDKPNLTEYAYRLLREKICKKHKVVDDRVVICNIILVVKPQKY
jgi:hypothetical protein